MELAYRQFELALRHHWAIATDLGRGGGKSVYPVVFVELKDGQGRAGLGEASPSSQYGENHATVTEFLARVDPKQLSFDDIAGSMAYIEGCSPAGIRPSAR